MARQGSTAAQPVVVRFLDDEIMEGQAEGLTFNEPGFVLRFAAGAGNNERAVVPLPSIKRVTFMARRPTRSQLAKALRKVAIRFQDGEVVKGYLSGEVKHSRYGMTIELVSVAKDRFERLGLPYSAIKALFYLKTWDSRPPEFEGRADAYVAKRLASPLVDLLSDMQSLSKLRDKGTITESEFARKRKQILDNI